MFHYCSNSRSAWIGFAFLFFSANVIAENIDMFVGEVKILGKVDVNRVAVGNGAILRTDVLDTGELLVIGQQAGSSSLRLWNKDGTQKNYNIRVSEKDPQKRVRMDHMIRIKVKMVQFRKNVLSNLGINWAQVAEGPTFATVGDLISSPHYQPPGVGGFSSRAINIKPFSSYLGISSAITSRINLLASDGDAVILSEPVLSCINGGTAKFLSGGEFPIPVVGNNGQTQVVFKQFGVQLEISPRVNESMEIHAAIKTEVSERDDDSKVLGVPGLTTTKTETIMNVHSGQTIVISGLLKVVNSKKTDRVPALGRVPLLGSLFRSKEKKDELTELVIFVTPEVVKVSDIPDRSSALKPGDSIEERADRLLKKRAEKIEQVTEKLDYSIMD